MAETSKNARQQYTLGGVLINAAEEWQDVEIVANYENDSVQPQISADNLVFNLEARLVILDWIRQGRIFEGLPIQINVFNNEAVNSNFRSILDFTKKYRELPEDGKIEVALERERGLVNFFDKISTVSYGYLETQGAIGPRDYINLGYVVEKKINAIEIVVLGLTLFVLTKETAESIRRTSKAIADITATTTGGATGPAAAAVQAVAIALLEAIYTAAILAALLTLARTLFETLIPPRRTHKAAYLGTLLRKVAEYYGFQMVFEDNYFDQLVYLPSNVNLDVPDLLGFIKTPKGTTKGIPESRDRGYIVSEMFELAKQLIDGKYAIINDNELHLRPRSSSFWINNALWQKPAVLVEQKEYNLQELAGTRTLEFETDLNDEWTIDNFTGTVYEVRTDVISAQNQDNVLIKNLERTQFGLALGNRKEDLNAFERSLRSLASVVDGVTGIFGGGSRYANRFDNRVGLLKVSQNDHSLPKLLFAPGGRIPASHRQNLSAKFLYQNYWQETSFVARGFRGQKAIYRQQEIPFGFEDYKILIDNPYFLDENGAESKIISFAWNIENDRAEISYWTREVYTTNLRETYIEP